MMQHALSACSVALEAGRYRWQHYQVMAVVVEVVQQEVMHQPARAIPDPSAAHALLKPSLVSHCYMSPIV